MDFKKSKALPILALFILSLIPLFDLIHPGLPLTHDGMDHVARIANFYKNLEEGVLIPRWAGNLNWGFGHPILMFLYPLPSYSASIFHFLGFSLIDSVKLVFGLSYFFSAAAMFLWVRNFLGEKEGLVAAILYIFAPYRFVDLYVRGAIGEHLAFVFAPLVLYFLLKISQKKFDIYSAKFYLFLAGGGLSFAGLILSHNAISLMLIPFIFFYILYLLWQQENKKTFLISSSLLIILGISLSFFFWFPAFFEGKYTLRDIVTKGEYANSFINFKSLIFGQWSFGGSAAISKQIGLVQIFFVLSLPFVLRRIWKKRKLAYLYIFVIIYFLLGVFLMLPYSGLLYSIITTLQKLQFPWRFLTVIVFTSSLLGAFFVYSLSKKAKSLSVVLVVLLALILNINYWHAKEYVSKDDAFFDGVYKSTTDTGESAPIWSIRFMEKEAKDALEIIDGQAKIQKRNRKSTFHSYEVNVSSQNARIKENTLYFPGWSVFVNGSPVSVEFQDILHRGLMTFYAPKGLNKIEVIFKETKLRNVANAITLKSILLFSLWGLLILLRNKLKR